MPPHSSLQLIDELIHEKRFHEALEWLEQKLPVGFLVTFGDSEHRPTNGNMGQVDVCRGIPVWIPEEYPEIPDTRRILDIPKRATTWGHPYKKGTVTPVLSPPFLPCHPCGGRGLKNECRVSRHLRCLGTPTYKL